MIDYVLCADAATDLFVVWSREVNDAAFAGSRDRVTDYLLQHTEHGPDPRDQPSEQLARAAATGTSAPPDAAGSSPVGAYSDPWLVVSRSGFPDSWLPRTRLAAYAHALLTGGRVTAHTLLEPFESTNSFTEDTTTPAGFLIIGSGDSPLTTAERVNHLLQQPARTGHSLYKLVNAWIAEKAKTPGSREAYQRDIREHLTYCAQHDLDPLTLAIPEFSIFKAWLQTRTTRFTPPGPYSDRYLRRKIMATASFYRYLVEVDARDRSPVTGLPKEPDTDTERTLTPAETDALFTTIRTTEHRTISPQCALLSAEFLFIGLRASEACGLNLSDLFTATHQDVRYLGMRYKAKGRKVMVRSIPEDIERDALVPYLETRPEPATPADKPALLLTRDGKRPNRFQLYRLIETAAQRAGIDNHVSPHWGRHTFKLDTEAAGAPIEVVQAALGHASVATTQMYGRVRRLLNEDPAHKVSQQRVQRRAQSTGNTPPDEAAPT